MGKASQLTSSPAVTDRTASPPRALRTETADTRLRFDFTPRSHSGWLQQFRPLIRKIRRLAELRYPVANKGNAE
jgi:hypothetical protein